jgi:hypothetical protein
MAASFKRSKAFARKLHVKFTPFAALTMPAAMTSHFMMPPAQHIFFRQEKLLAFWRFLHAELALSLCPTFQSTAQCAIGGCSPKMLTMMAFTWGSDVRILNASTT